MSMITASLWVPRGAAAENPTQYHVDEKELARISNLAKLQLEDAKDDLREAQNGQPERGEERSSSGEEEEEEEDLKMTVANGDADDDLKEYDLDTYDDEKPQEDPLTAMFGSLAYYQSNADDPNLTTKGNDEDDEEREDLRMLATDNMVVAAKVEEEVALLEIYVYEDEADNLYVHHDYPLPAIPLCVEWLDLPVGGGLPIGKGTATTSPSGNYVAVGTMDPDIELWDLDTTGSMYPTAILGQGSLEENASKVDPDTEHKKKKKKRKNSKKVNDNYHVDAVLSLAANRLDRKMLASASADRTIKLWNLTTQECVKSFSYHTDKVCSIAWHSEEAPVLLSGSYDRTVVVADVRLLEPVMGRWGVESDVETVAWDPHDANYFYVTTENGMIHYHDRRTAPSSPEKTKPVWTLQAHNSSVSSFDINPQIPGFLATGSTDKEVKLWNVQPSGPSMVVSRNLGVGKVFTTKFAPDREVTFRLAVAGSKGAMQIWDTSTNPAVRNAFAGRAGPVVLADEGKERVVGVDEDSSDDEDEGGLEPGGETGPVDDGWESMDEA
ncbi:MAG: hypothetical protein LQ345_003057 [Seirophora villosa]|nr:MAG: hypothetical protein LQ345_003057 [Seirophora villosa]